jgi:hypothetical protein
LRRLADSAAAATPEPQLVITGWSRSTPPALSAALISSGGSSRPFSIKALDGTLSEPGIWPSRTPGRGSGASPRKRSPGRESMTWAVLFLSAACTSLSAATMAGGLLARNVRGARFEAPVSSGRPSAFHFGSPPSSTNTFSAPNSRNVHHTRGEENMPAPS